MREVNRWPKLDCVVRVRREYQQGSEKKREDYGPLNFNVLRHLALNLLKQEKTSNRSIKGKRLQAAWNTDYLEKILAGLANLA